MLQAIFRALTGQGSTLAIVASTLAIAALFQPWLVRVRAVVDRRFYRARYDAARTLATFGAALQSETDLTRLSWRLAEVVEEALRPEHVSLWLIGRPHRHGDGPTHVEVVRVEPAASSSPAADSVGETHAAAPSPAPRPGFAP